MKDLTPRQEQLLGFICGFIESYGYCPSVRDIGEGIGTSSTATVHAHLQALQKKGRLRVEPGRSRALVVIR